MTLPGQPAWFGLVLFSWMMKCKICGRIFKPKLTMIEHILNIHGVFFPNTEIGKVTFVDDDEMQNL